jgi:hypothetical protein
MALRTTLCGFFATVVVACAATPRAPTEPVPKVHSDPAPSLFELLEGLDRPPLTVDALPGWARTAADKLLAQLSEDERHELAAGTHPLAMQHPLLHWAAGGNSLDVARSAALGSALVDEWAALALNAKPPPDPSELLDVGNELERRAALHLLRERAADFAPGRTPSATALSDVSRTAALLELDPIARLAAEDWATRTGDPDALVLLVRRAAKALDPEQAEATLARFPHEPASADARRTANELVAALHRIAKRESSPVAMARDYIELGRYDLALGTLSKTTSEDLATATELARAEFEGSVCPGVLRPNAPLCRVAFAERARSLGLSGSLDQAWATGAGRDDAAIEHYLGLRFVSRLMYRVSDEGKALGPTELATTLRDLGNRAEQAAQSSPRFEALALLSHSLLEALLATSHADPGSRPQIPAARRVELRKQALELVTSTPSAWSADAALATLALSLQDDALGPELDAIGTHLGERQPVMWSALELWTALADGDSARLDTAKSRLVDVLGATSGDERASWLLSFGEADAALRPGEQTSATLLHLCERLRQPGTPLDLELRAHLDAAGAHARTGDTRAALDELSAAHASLNPGSASSTSSDLGLLVSGYQSVLLSSQPGKAQSALDALSELLGQSRARGQGSPSIIAWLDLWRRELGARVAAERCGKSRSCRDEARAQAGLSAKAIETTLGARTAELFARGLVPLGGAQLDIGYDGWAIRPRVGLELAFPLVPVPALD